jgi:GT2 family glycosyltransferase
MIYLISLNYNSSRLTIELLESLKKVTTEYRIIIVDNQSQEDDFNTLKTYVENESNTVYLVEDIDEYRFVEPTRIALVREDQNLGYSAGNNRGIRIAQKQTDFEAIALLNNDTEVEPDFLDEIIRFRRDHSDVDLIGCRIFYDTPKNVLWYDGGKYYKHSTRAIHFNENKHIDTIDKSLEPRSTTFITGCFMYISKKGLETCGLLDETFFMYNEDLEYCIRAMKKGLKLYYLPTSVIRHKIKPTSSPFSTYWGAKNRFRLSKLHSNKSDQLYTIIFYILTRIPRYSMWLSKGRFDLIKAQFKGMLDGLKEMRK